MSRPLALGTFVLVALAIIAGLHYYFFARLVRDTALPQPWRTLAGLALTGLAASMPLSFFVVRRLPRGAARFFTWPAYVWMGLMLLLFVSLVSTDLLRAVLWAARRLTEDPIAPGRRVFLGRLFGGGAAAAAVGLGAQSLRGALRPPTVTRMHVTLSRLPRALDGTTIVQLTDLHLGPTLGREWLEDVVERTNALRPDLIVITGDLADGSVAELRDVVAPVSRLNARYGVFFVTGNHEYYAGADAWIAELRRLGIRVLRNERVAIGDGAASFDLVGIDDFNARGLAPGHGPDLPRALEGRDPSRELVLLAHQPKAIHEAVRAGVGLQLSGHTHGGQIWPWNYAVLLQQPYVAGLVREADTTLYVSRGTGYWGPPMRLGATAEIAHLTLRAAT